MKKQDSYKKFLKFVIVIGIVAYIIMFIDTFFMQDIETIILESGTIEDKKVIDAIITRTEDVVSLDTKEQLYPIVSSGERVSKGQVLAIIKDQSVLNIEQQLAELNESIGDIAIPNSYDSEVKTIDSKLNGLLHQVIKESEYKSFKKIIAYKEELNEYLGNKVQKIAERDSGNNEINKYLDKVSEYEKKLKSLETTVKSTIAGTVVYKLDGYEEVLTKDNISNYTPQMLEKFNIPKGELVGSSKLNSFKIVDNLECYITIILSDEEAEEIFVDQKVKIRFPEIDTHLEVTGVIDYINFSKEGVVVTFKINRSIEDILNYRKTKVEIIWDSESGYKVPNNAIIEVDGVKKVYVYLNRNYLVEKKVEIVKEFDGYSIISGSDGDKLYLYDNIVINAANVNKNKLLKD